MDPRLQVGLFNPHPYVRGAATAALGKKVGEMSMKRAEKETREAEARTEQLRAAEADRVFTLRAWDGEERATYGDWVKEGEGGEQEIAVAKEEGDEGEAAASETDDIPVAAVATGGEETGAQKPAGMQQQQLKKKKKVRVNTITIGFKQSPPSTSLIANKLAPGPFFTQQPLPPIQGTAWFLQRGKELDSKRT